MFERCKKALGQWKGSKIYRLWSKIRFLEPFQPYLTFVKTWCRFVGKIIIRFGIEFAGLDILILQIKCDNYRLCNIGSEFRLVDPIDNVQKPYQLKKNITLEHGTQRMGSMQDPMWQKWCYVVYEHVVILSLTISDPVILGIIELTNNKNN